jgi:hypothetical protein
MSASGHKLPRDLIKGAAALLPKAAGRSLAGVSAKGHKRAHALQHKRKEKDRLAAVSPKSDQAF